MSLKKALATLLATVMMLSLVSCGSKSNEEAPGDASKPTESAESSGKIKVGFSSAAFSDEWCHNLALAFENFPIGSKKIGAVHTVFTRLRAD